MASVSTIIYYSILDAVFLPGPDIFAWDPHEVRAITLITLITLMSAKFSVFAVNGDGSAVVTLEGPVE